MISDATLEPLLTIEASCLDEITVPAMAFIKFKFKDDTVFVAVYCERPGPDDTSVAIFMWAILSVAAVCFLPASD